jgi:hypothetical protein
MLNVQDGQIEAPVKSAEVRKRRLVTPVRHDDDFGFSGEALRQRLQTGEQLFRAIVGRNDDGPAE